MTKKHYEAIASILAIEMQNGTTQETVEAIAGALCDYFASDNPRFNRVRFLKACGIEPDHNWLCMECGKRKEEYEPAYCDGCWEKEQSQA